jgi:carboxylesterase
VPLLPGAEPFRHDAGPIGALLCHGFTSTPQPLRPWAQHLAAAGLSVRLPRLPGHGTRWQELNLTRWEDWYAEVEHALDEVVSRCDRVFAMGLSMGGTLALRLAEQRGPDVAGLVLVNPALLSQDKRMRLLPVLRLVLPSLAGVGNDIKKPGVTELAYDRLPLKALHSLTRLWALTRADLAKVTQPILIFRSREDHVIEPASVTVLREGVAATEVEERLCEDSYHVATLDNDAPAILAGSLAFVRAHSPSLSGGA